MARYTVGLKKGGRSKALSVEGEDALMAALSAKLDNPAATITYVRKANRRVDRRHPHAGLPAASRGPRERD